MFTTKNQKDLHTTYRAELGKAWGNDEHMIDYCDKAAELIVKLSGGYLLEIPKEKIETDFCFGYSDSAYDTEDYDRANNMADRAAKDVEYFRAQNLKSLNRGLEDVTNAHKLYTYPHYSGQTADCKLVCIVFDRQRRDDYEYIELRADDIEIIKNAYIEAISRREKKIDAYLKRYGMSKVNTWSYWADR